MMLRTLSQQTRMFSTVNRRMAPSAVIFDKDGTLIDFHLMWSAWAEQIAWTLEGTTGIPVREDFFHAIGYEYTKRRVISGGALCCTPMHELRQLTVSTLAKKANTSETAAAEVVNKIWSMPDPKISARPLADLNALFNVLKGFDMKIAVCTADDHIAAEKTLKHLGVLHYVDIILGGDDPVPKKPAPEQIWHICHKLGVLPQDCIMVGDTATDMKMGTAAGAGLSVGILGGASSVDDLAAHADVLIPHLGRLNKIIFQFGRKKLEDKVYGFDDPNGFIEKELAKLVPKKA